MPTYNLLAYGGTGLGYGRSSGYSFVADANNTASVVAQDDDAILNDWSTGNYHGTNTPGIWNGDTSSIALDSEIPWLSDGEMITSGVWYDLSFTNPETGATESVEAFLIWDDTNNYWGGYQNSYVFTTAPLLDGVTYTVTSVDNNAGVPWDALVCFANGTQIRVPTGEIAVEELSVGDEVVTLDNQIMPIRWIGKRALFEADMQLNPNFRPVRILAGALGSGLPKRDLLVSQQHRMLVASEIAKRMFGQSEVLIPSLKLTELSGIYIDNSLTNVEYYHILLDSHAIVFAEHAPAESMLTGKEAWNAVGSGSRTKINSLLNAEFAEDSYRETAKLIPRSPQQKRLISRHLKNNQPLIASCQIM